jgi:hypothetical protein
MKTIQITTDQIADYLVKNHESKLVDFINSKAQKLYGASYRSGAYGRIFVNFIKEHYPTGLNLNGGSTSIALAITDKLNSLGYDYINKNSVIGFGKTN